jgi:two-component system, chemotaxis family, sensor kinase CheA
MPIPNHLFLIHSDLESHFHSLEGGNLDILDSLRFALAQLGEDPSIPSAMRTLSSRLTAALDGIASKAIDESQEVPKLLQGVAKLLRSVEGLPGSNAMPEGPATFAPPESVPPDCEEMDLLERFASRQKGELEEFEVAILEREKGSDAGNQFVKRYLHTLKGEFGVLDLGEWSNLVHEIETAMEERRIGTEGLLRFKDLLGDRLPTLGSSRGRKVSPEDSLVVFGSKPGTAPEAETASGSASTNFAADPSFLVDFIAEGGDHIHNMEKSLLKLEVNPADDESINMVFRSCHTLKGLAGFLELKDIQRLAHAAESLMDRARNHLIVLAPQHVDVLLETMDTFRLLVDGLEKVVSGEAMDTPKNLETLIERLVDADYLPPLPTLGPEKSGQKMGDLLIGMGVAPDAIEKALKIQEDGDSRHLGEILIQSGDANPRDVGQILGQKAQADKTTSGRTLAVEETIRVPVQRLDLLIDAIGEAVIAQSMVWADPRLQEVRDLSLEKKIGQASLMLRQIQELSMSLRMVGIRSTFQKMSRLVRDLARKLDKQIELCMEGEDTELDKTVVENIGDPLVHMVRNSVDHGIEMPDERIKAGKPPQGKIHLRAYHKAGSVYIEIEDDGKGLDRDAILKKAVASGKARADVSYSDAEVYQMVFLPGLSTAKAVTDVSGRGVGMDVVKRNIEALRGTVEIRSEKGQGSCFVIRLPLTLAIIQGMVVRSANERYIVPTLSILTTVRPDADHLSTVVGKGEILHLRGELVRLIRLQRIFGIPIEPVSSERSDADAASNEVVIVVEDAFGRKIGIVVDEILEQQQVVIKNIGGGMGQVPGITGGAVMSDGSVSLILDVGAVVKIASE